MAGRTPARHIGVIMGAAHPREIPRRHARMATVADVIIISHRRRRVGRTRALMPLMPVMAVAATLDRRLPARASPLLLGSLIHARRLTAIPLPISPCCRRFVGQQGNYAVGVAISACVCTIQSLDTPARHLAALHWRHCRCRFSFGSAFAIRL